MEQIESKNIMKAFSCLTPYPTLIVRLLPCLYSPGISRLTLMSISSVSQTPCEPPTTLSSVSHNPDNQPPTIRPTNRNSGLPFWGILYTYISRIFLDHCQACHLRMLYYCHFVSQNSDKIQSMPKIQPTNFQSYQINIKRRDYQYWFIILLNS